MICDILLEAAPNSLNSTNRAGDLALHICLRADDLIAPGSAYMPPFRFSPRRMKHLLKRFPDALRIRGAHEELPIEIAWRLNLGFETYADIYGVDPDFADVRYLNQYFEKKVMVVTMLCFSQFAVGENILPFGVGGRGLNHFSSRMWRKIFGFLWDIEDADPIVDEFVNILDDPSLRN